ncbi:RNA polymerase sigma factor RpoE [Paralysiella testudinis]|uniref:RNA polymerase sigma factor RpoE n=1 Tax=Paralysiella testudinis TaxID=2809020 RepID=A0A892ZKP3_9NEIS|nr:RNA polymerase sigma factor RpoE [Paralysiella testudinis]QRQ83193.1 RNA polymerase sigma factor RpoE [Paralysiella testudinis]
MNDCEVDRVLVERAQKGDSRAFELLVSKYQRRLTRLLFRFVKDEHEVNDVAQEAFIKAYRALPNFRGDSAFYTWLYRIAINTAKNFLVVNGRQPVIQGGLANDEGELLDLTEQMPDYRTPETDLLNREIIHTVDAAVAGLPEELRQAIMLREMEGLSYEEIAQTMNCPIGTVRSRIFRAREVIAKELRPLLDTAENQRW